LLCIEGAFEGTELVIAVFETSEVASTAVETTTVAAEASEAAGASSEYYSMSTSLEAQNFTSSADMTFSRVGIQNPATWDYVAQVSAPSTNLAMESELSFQSPGAAAATLGYVSLLAGRQVLYGEEGEMDSPLEAPLGFEPLTPLGSSSSGASIPTTDFSGSPNSSSPGIPLAFGNDALPVGSINVLPSEPPSKN